MLREVMGAQHPIWILHVIEGHWAGRPETCITNSEATKVGSHLHWEMWKKQLRKFYVQKDKTGQKSREGSIINLSWAQIKGRRQAAQEESRGCKAYVRLPCDLPVNGRHSFLLTPVAHLPFFLDPVSEPLCLTSRETACKIQSSTYIKKW
jgi:hypothetical protein